MNMVISSRLKVVCFCLFTRFLFVSSQYSYSCSASGQLLNWPNISAESGDQISISSCINLNIIPAFAAADRPDLIRLRLQRNAFVEVNETWIQKSPNIEQIWLHENKLTSIPPLNCGPPGSEGCPNLAVFRIDGNLITILQARSFANHPKLQQLDFYNNRITTLVSNWIVDCPSITRIALDGNRNLNSFFISEDPKSEGLPELSRLSFYESNISSLDRNFLIRYPKLTFLFIASSPINILPLFVASHPVKIAVMSMGNFVCDCSTTKLALNGMIDSDNEAGFCASPDYNVGKNFSQLECRATPATTEMLSLGCDALSMRKLSSLMEFRQNLAFGESEILLEALDVSMCASVSVRILDGGSSRALTRATYRACPLVALSSLTCHYLCQCRNVTCSVYVK